jgi:hypothetical protein
MDMRSMSVSTEGPKESHRAQAIRNRATEPELPRKAWEGRLYAHEDVEYLDGHRAAMSANTIAENMFAQVDQDGHRLILFDEII